MTPERWLRLEEIFDSAAELAPNTGLPHLDQAFADDTGLHRQVESLMISSDDAGGLIEGAIQDAASLATARQTTALAGLHRIAWAASVT